MNFVYQMFLSLTILPQVLRSNKFGGNAQRVAMQTNSVGVTSNSIDSDVCSVENNILNILISSSSIIAINGRLFL